MCLIIRSFAAASLDAWSAILMVCRFNLCQLREQSWFEHENWGGWINIQYLLVKVASAEAR
jgi:hypothetical protein